MKSLYVGKFSSGNYKTTFTEEVDQLVKQDLTPEFKNKIVQALTDVYIEETGKVPASFELDRLSTWIVEDKSRNPDKVTNTEFPVLSESQIKLRRRREMVSEHIAETSSSSTHKMNGKRKPKSFKVFGEYEGGY